MFKWLTSLYNFSNYPDLDEELDVVVVGPDDLVEFRLLLIPLFLHLLKFWNFTFHHLPTFNFNATLSLTDPCLAHSF